MPMPIQADKPACNSPGLQQVIIQPQY